MTELWRPTANISNIQARADLLRCIRSFFADRKVMEVETPILSAHATTDPNIESIRTFDGYLQTSPEFAMKRLLSAQVGSIYQIAKAFRKEESGRWHNNEFTMLEWYRVDYNHWQLMREIDDLLQAVLNTAPSEQISYQNVFIRELNLDPLNTDKQTLEKRVEQCGISLVSSSSLSCDDLLNLLFTHRIESRLGHGLPTMIHSYPASQSALAKISSLDPRVADRFEVYVNGIELANGFYELQDPTEQQERFDADNAARIANGQTAMPSDPYLIDALSAGLPECAGVALGIDRLLMLKVGADHINDVLAFPSKNA